MGFDFTPVLIVCGLLGALALVACYGIWWLVGGGWLAVTCIALFMIGCWWFINRNG